MARLESSILTGDPGRAQTAAVTVLALLAGAQMLLIAKALWHPAEPPPSGPAAAASQASAPAAAPSLLSPPRPGQLAGGPELTAPPAFSSPGLSPPAPGMLANDSPAATPPPPPASQSPAPPPRTDPEVAELLTTVTQLRASGETQSVLELLSAAEGMAQNHPEVLKEFALTYEQMGFHDQARQYWQRIEALGSTAAGPLHLTAREKLGRAGEVEVISPPSATPVFPISPAVASGEIETAPEAVLGIGPCHISLDATNTEGDRRLLRIPILRLRDEQIVPADVNVDVFFYDLVNGARVEPTRADPPMFNWMAMPVDWTGLGAEPLDVVYHLPRLSIDEEKTHGIREYHGYVVKLYYQNKLQATAADPGELLKSSGTPAEDAPSKASP